MHFLRSSCKNVIVLALELHPYTPFFIKPYYLDPWIKDPVKITPLSSILPLATIAKFCVIWEGFPSSSQQNS